MLIAYATIAMLKASPATSPNLDVGGNEGGGKLYTLHNKDTILVTC